MLVMLTELVKALLVEAFKVTVVRPLRRLFVRYFRPCKDAKTDLITVAKEGASAPRAESEAASSYLDSRCSGGR